MSNKNTVNWGKVMSALQRGFVPGAAIGGICLIGMYWWAALLIAIPSSFFLGLCFPDKLAIEEAEKQKELQASHKKSLYSVKEDMSEEFYE